MYTVVNALVLALAAGTAKSASLQKRNDYTIGVFRTSSSFWSTDNRQTLEAVTSVAALVVFTTITLAPPRPASAQVVTASRLLEVARSTPGQVLTAMARRLRSPRMEDATRSRSLVFRSSARCGTLQRSKLRSIDEVQVAEIW